MTRFQCTVVIEIQMLFIICIMLNNFLISWYWNLSYIVGVDEGLAVEIMVDVSSLTLGKYDCPSASKK